jgi:hypothetical protein
VENAENAQEEEASNPLPIDNRKDAHDDATGLATCRFTNKIQLSS